jgi:hypothetical protein
MFSPRVSETHLQRLGAGTRYRSAAETFTFNLPSLRYSSFIELLDRPLMSFEVSEPVYSHRVVVVHTIYYLTLEEEACTQGGG